MREIDLGFMLTKEWSDERPDIITDEHDDLISEEDWI
uniref:Uncharacterized protein n=1 Tax=Pseudomonas phage RVTF4 TaxID=3236931 RepID=A0AB39CC68_9VIRU